jgi:hypothetical protein
LLADGNLQPDSEVCASKPYVHEDDNLDSTLPERVAHISGMVSIQLMEIKGLKASLNTAAQKRDAAAHDVREVELMIQSLRAQMQMLTTQSSSTAASTKDETKMEIIADMLRENETKLHAATSEAEKRECELREVQASMTLKQSSVSALTDEISLLRRGSRPSGLKPWPMIYPDTTPGGPALRYIEITACCLCGFEFPDSDIIVANCLHLYHPWYAVVVFGKGVRCVQAKCCGLPHPNWHKSFGWGLSNEDMLDQTKILGCEQEMARLFAAREEKAKANCEGEGKGQFLDGFSGYNQVFIRMNDQLKTTFTTEWGTFAFNRMPFGLCNAPGTFQRLMMDIFKDFLRHFLEVFIDDFAMFSNKEDHLEYLRKTFQRCRETNLKLHPGKCFFGMSSGILLRHTNSLKEYENVI